MSGDERPPVQHMLPVAADDHRGKADAHRSPTKPLHFGRSSKLLFPEEPSPEFTIVGW